MEPVWVKTSMKLNAKQLRTQEPTEEEIKTIKRNPIYLVLDNVLDTYNIGSLFRLADAVAAEKIYLCGQTEFPPNTKITKASVDTWKWVPWEYSKSTLSVIKELNKKGVQIIAVEQHKGAISYTELAPKFPVAIVVGNETYGITQAVLKEADIIVELPMWGVNKSLNVMVTAGVVLYKVMERL